MANSDCDNWFNRLSYSDLEELVEMWSLDFCCGINSDTMSEKEFITAMKRWWDRLDNGEKYEVKDSFYE